MADSHFWRGKHKNDSSFFIKYLRTLGYDVTNDVFAENAWYFRNSLVRANYNDLKNGIHETTEYIELFLRNLLLNEKHPLRNRTLHIKGIFTEFEKPDIGDQKPDIGDQKPDIGDQRPDIGDQKPDIGGQKPDIGDQKPDIETAESIIGKKFQPKTTSSILKLCESFPEQATFGRSDVMNVIGIKPSRASELLKEMGEKGIIEPVLGQGKGKYRFKEMIFQPENSKGPEGAREEL